MLQLLGGGGSFQDTSPEHQNGIQIIVFTKCGIKNNQITRKTYTYITKLSFDLHGFVVIRCKTSWVEAPSFTYKASIFRGYFKRCPSY